MFYFQGHVIYKERKLQTQVSESKLCHIHLSTFLLWQTEVLPDYDHLTAHTAIGKPISNHGLQIDSKIRRIQEVGGNKP